MSNQLFSQVRLIHGSENTVMSIEEAQREAEVLNMDLVIIDEKSNPPVAKIMDEGKYKYELAKKQKRMNKQQRAAVQKQKEIQLRPVTGDNDIIIKAKNANTFLSEGNTVKISVRFRGRENSHILMGENVINKLLSNLTDFKITHDTRGSGKEVMVIVARSVDE